MGLGVNMDNLIFNSDTDETYGLYSDIVKFYKKEIKNAVELNEYDNARDLMEQLEEIDNWTDLDGILVLSMNNGMGFSVKQYKGE